MEPFVCALFGGMQDQRDTGHIDLAVKQGPTAALETKRVAIKAMPYLLCPYPRQGPPGDTICPGGREGGKCTLTWTIN